MENYATNIITRKSNGSFGSPSMLLNPRAVRESALPRSAFHLAEKLHCPPEELFTSENVNQKLHPELKISKRKRKRKGKGK